jgi:hypothetical protein
MAHFTQIDATVSLLAPSGSLTAPTTATIANIVSQNATGDLTIGKELIEATSLGDDWRQFAPGVGEWSGSLTLNVDPGTAANHDELLECILAADFGGSLSGGTGQVQVNWFIDTTAGAGKAFYGAMFVEDFTLGVGSGLSGMTVRLRGNGVVKYAGSLL